MFFPNAEERASARPTSHHGRGKIMGRAEARPSECLSVRGAPVFFGFARNGKLSLARLLVNSGTIAI